MTAGPSLRSGGGARAGITHSELARQLVHMSMGGFALLLRWLLWWQALALASAALAFNILVLPRIGRRLYRRPDAIADGIVFYPIAVLVLLLLFPRAPSIVAGAWGILAAGDGIATIAGRAIGGPRWPWNRDKTVAGSVAFALAGGAACAFLAWWCLPADAYPVSFPFIVAGAACAATVAAAVETIPVRLDDNLSVAISAGGMLWIVWLIGAGHASAPSAGGQVSAALAINGAVALAGYYLGTVSASGALTGLAIGAVIYAAAGWQGWVLLLVTFALATATTRMGLRRKVLLGIAEERGGRRGGANAVANTGVAAIAAILAVASAHQEAARWAFVAALTAGGSDTVASEIGKAWGRTTWSVIGWGRVAPGTSGAMSSEGTAAGVAAALALATLGIALGLVPGVALVPLVVAATVGSLVESGLGATLEAPGILNNDMLNFLNTAVAALIAAAWAGHA